MYEIYEPKSCLRILFGNITQGNKVTQSLLGNLMSGLVFNAFENTIEVKQILCRKATKKFGYALK